MRQSPIIVTDELSDAQRLHRIAELLCKAILLAEASRAVLPAVSLGEPAEAVTPTGFADDNMLSEDERVLNYLDLVDSASPAMIRSALGFSRSGTYRILNRLTNAGCIAASGQTRVLVYRLNRSEPPVEKIGLN